METITIATLAAVAGFLAGSAYVHWLAMRAMRASTERLEAYGDRLAALCEASREATTNSRRIVERHFPTVDIKGDQRDQLAAATMRDEARIPHHFVWEPKNAKH